MTNQLQHRSDVELCRDRRGTVGLIIGKHSTCLCLHVKPTTIFIAVFKLIRALLFASILLNAEFTVNEQINDFGITTLEERHKSTAIAVELLRRIIMICVSTLAIYSVITGRANFLMPFYGVLMIEFFFSLPSFYKWDIDPYVADSLADFRNNNSTSNNAYTRYSLMLFSTITMLVKIYFLCVIWKCYRYLRLIELVAPLSTIYPHVHQNGPQYPIVRVLGSADSSDLQLVNGNNMAPPPYESIASNMKPPNYEEAMKSTNMSFTTSNPNSTTNNQQQTVVIASINEQHQNTSTQIVNDLNVRQAIDTSINESVVVSTIPIEPKEGNSNDNNCDYLNSSNEPTTDNIIINSSAHENYHDCKSSTAQVAASNNVNSIEINVNNVTPSGDIPKQIN